MSLAPEVQKARARWVKALRSGRYRQTKGELSGDVLVDGTTDKYERGYCCLGVAVDVFTRGWDVDEWGPRGTLLDVAYDDDTQKRLRGVAEKLDLHGDRETWLTQWNDGGKRFDFIADQIESWKT